MFSIIWMINTELCMREINRLSNTIDSLSASPYQFILWIIAVSFDQHEPRQLRFARMA